MQISILDLLVTLVLYLAAAAAPVAYIVRLRRCAERPSSVPDGAISTVGDIAALVAISTAASAVLLTMPANARGVVAFASGLPMRAAELGGFCAAQAIWSLPSACFHVLGSRLPGSRFSARVVVRSSLALLLGVLAVSLVAGSARWLGVAGLIAQVVAGFLPLSVASDLPIVLSIAPASGAGDVDIPALSPLRTAALCVAVAVGAVLWRRRTPT